MTSSSLDGPALTIANLDEAVKRAKAHEAGGVDAIFLASGGTLHAVEMVSSAIKIPLILGRGGGQLGDLNWLPRTGCVALKPGHEDGGSAMRFFRGRAYRNSPHAPLSAMID